MSNSTAKSSAPIVAPKSSPAETTSSCGEFAGRRVLVTGGTRGIGRAIAVQFAAAGARVAVTARSIPAKTNTNDKGAGADETKPSTSSAEPELFIAADVSTAAGCTLISNTVLSAWGGVDILVHNAGGTSMPAGGALAQTESVWESDLGLNLLASVRLDRALLPAMVEQKSGVIVHISTIASRKPRWQQTLAYSAAKAALNAYSKGLSQEFGPAGVRVNVVAPGFIESDAAVSLLEGISSATGQSYTDARQALVQAVGIPLGRAGRPEDIAEMVAFLASEKGQYCNGAIINVDGGAWDFV